MTRRGPLRFAGRLAVLAVLAAALMPLGAGAAAKDYYFPEVRVELRVEPDGTFIVDEFRTFEFRGSFTYAYITIPVRIERLGVRQKIEISEFGLTDEQGRPLRTDISESGGKFTAKWYYSARNTRRTFHIHYRVTGGITSYADATELYCQVIGDGWDKPARNVQATVTLPRPVPSRSDLLIWGHGPLAGSSEIVDERTARFSTPALASHQFFEVRVVWPPGLVAGAPSTRLTLAAIKAEEEGYVRDTIERVERDRARREVNRKAVMKGLGAWGIWQIAGPLFWLLVFIRVWSAVGKDYRFENLPDYVRELPADRPPAVVQTLMREGRAVTTAAFTATIFDLARRRLLEIEDRTVEKRRLFGIKEALETAITLKKDPAGEAGLRPYERSLVDFLYEDQPGGAAPGAVVTIDQFEAALKKNPQKFQTWYRKWTRAIKDETKPLGFLEPASVRARNRFYIATIPAAVLTLSPVLLVLSLALIPTLKRRTMDWARENEAWKGLDRFLDDFSDFKEIPPEAYKLWEHYLVFGILFGNAKKILKMLPLILRDERAAAPLWYAGLGRPGGFAGGGFDHLVSSIEHAATSISQASTAAAHYSSGGGGGFSGGGGGGVGGGGGGAG